MKFLKLILIPFIPVYGAIISIRNFLFDKMFFESKSVNAKVTSVGNITLGGSGKTPTVIFVTNLLKNENKNVGVLSRGYGRSSTGYQLVSKGSGILTTVEQSGDEMYHTALECKVPAAVCENRVEGAVRLIEETGINFLVLDDAFQHRWIKRDVNLLVFEQRFLLSSDFFVHKLFPTGTLREPFSVVKRADAVIINRKFSEPEDIPIKRKKYFKDVPVFTAHYKAISFIDLNSKQEYNLEEFKGQKSLVVSGIANPFSFLNILRQTNVDTTNKMIFKDHKKYSLKEVERIRKKFYTSNSHSVVTTEKDAVKLSKYSKELDDIDIFYLKIILVMDDEIKFKKFLLNKLA
ncbi:MAG: tetraacyldisaccharide 4'-kinase [Ignavibacteriales bacterium]|nr:tetraacyldisaccharide 4'-kinase [Ignavibacteriales bacterium]